MYCFAFFYGMCVGMVGIVGDYFASFSAVHTVRREENALVCLLGGPWSSVFCWLGDRSTHISVIPGRYTLYQIYFVLSRQKVMK